MDKYDRYRELVARRKACRACPELINPSVYQGGVFDSGHIGPWSQWHGDLNAKLVVVGQDWGDIKYFSEHKGYDAEENPTNKFLIELIRLIGFEVSPLSGKTPDYSSLFFTNAILCLKKEGMSSSVKYSWVNSCGLFLRETINIIRPAILVTLGRPAYISIMRLYGLKREKYKDLAGQTQGLPLFDTTAYFPMYHPSPLVRLKARKKEQQEEDWQRIKSILYST